MRSLARPPALSTAPSLMLQSPIYEGAVASSMAACRRASRPLSPLPRDIRPKIVGIHHRGRACLPGRAFPLLSCFIYEPR